MISWPQDFATNFQFLLRWMHFLGGDHLDRDAVLLQPRQRAVSEGARRARRRARSIRPLLTRTLFWFRWGADVHLVSRVSSTTS